MARTLKETEKALPKASRPRFFCVAYGPPFVLSTSPKCIDREGLGRRYTGSSPQKQPTTTDNREIKAWPKNIFLAPVVRAQGTTPDLPLNVIYCLAN